MKMKLSLFVNQLEKMVHSFNHFSLSMIHDSTINRRNYEK